MIIATPLGAQVNLSDVYPPQGHVQRLYCDKCSEQLDLAFKHFHEDVSGVDIDIKGLPILRCEACQLDYLPDRTRFTIITLHEQATKQHSLVAKGTRRKPNKQYGFTNVPFRYDSDDYEYIPGLKRPWNSGFLTPVFFNKAVLLKYEVSPIYCVKFASTTYGTIVADQYDIAFGINKHGKVIMWLGDIAKLPEDEQYYLRSENVASDHSIGSEFYQGQIHCIYTEASRENKLFALRSGFIEACFKRFGAKIAHLDNEVLDLAIGFNTPVVDTPKERRHVADTLNKIYIESLDNGALGSLMTKAGRDPKDLRGLKRLQAVLETVTDAANAARLLMPLYVLYDLRLAYSHLTSNEKSQQILKSVTDRLGMIEGAGLMDIYGRLTTEISSSLTELTELTLHPSTA